MTRTRITNIEVFWHNYRLARRLVRDGHPPRMDAGASGNRIFRRD
jgi:hypothetical protein